MPQQKISLQQFGDNLKAKYGNTVLPDGRTYNEVDSTEAAQKFLQKHPEYQSAVETRGLVEQGWDKLAEVTPGFGVARGVAKEAVQFGANVGELTSKFAETATTPMLKLITGKEYPPSGIPESIAQIGKESEPKGLQEKAGQIGAQIAEFAIPEIGPAKVAKLASEWKIATPALKMGIAALNTLKDIGIAGIQTRGDVGAMGLTGAASGILRGVPQVAQIPAVKNAMLKTFGYFSGLPKEWLNVATQRHPATVEGLQKGVAALEDKIRSAFPKFREYAGKVKTEGETYVQGLEDAVKSTGFNPATTPEVQQAANSFATKVGGLLKQYKIGVTGEGRLIFNQPSNSSNIVSRADQQALQGVIDEMNKLRNIKLSNIDSVYETMLSYLKGTPSGTPTGPETKKIIQELMNETLDFTKNLGSLAGQGAKTGTEVSKVLPAQYAEYAAYKEANITLRKWINNIEETFGFSTAYPSPKEEEAALTRMLQAFNENRGPTQKAAQELGTTVGDNFLESAAGAKLKMAGAPLTQTIPFTKVGLGQRILNALPRKLIQNYVETGSFSALEIHPIVAGLAKLFNVSVAEIAKEIGDLLTHQSEQSPQESPTQ